MNNRQRQIARYLNGRSTKVVAKAEEKKQVQWVRILKPKARKMWEAGQTIKVVPCKADPYSPWFVGEGTNRERCNNCTFDFFLAEYEHYNCTCNELGYYPAYYVTPDTMEAYTGKEGK